MVKFIIDVGPPARGYLPYSMIYFPTGMIYVPIQSGTYDQSYSNMADWPLLVIAAKKTNRDTCKCVMTNFPI